MFRQRIKVVRQLKVYERSNNFASSMDDFPLVILQSRFFRQIFKMLYLLFKIGQKLMTVFFPIFFGGLGGTQKKSPTFRSPSPPELDRVLPSFVGYAGERGVRGGRGWQGGRSEKNKKKDFE